MKKIILLTVASALVGFNIWLYATGKTFFYKAVIYNYVNIDDYEIFDNRTIRKSSGPQPWLRSATNKVDLTPKLDSVLTSLESVAFTVIKDKEILQEHYWDGYAVNSMSNTFSAAKSYVSALIGIAYKEGLIKSIEDPVGNYLESFKTDGKEKIRILDLLKMSSGLYWEETYSGPFSMTTESYYGQDLDGLINRLKVAKSPGKSFKYSGADTQILAMILSSVTKMTLSEYAQKKLWEPLGFEYDALWSLDKEEGVEKAYCCINSNATDLARLGRLYNHRGNWNGHQIINVRYVDASINPAQYAEGSCNYYGFMWWLYDKIPGKKVFYARGILGQYIICIPSEDLVIVRLGHKRSKKSASIHPDEVEIYIEEILKMHSK